MGKVADSYSRACKNRMESMLDGYVHSLNDLASVDSLKNLLYGVRILIDYRNRHLSDFAEIILEKDPKARIFSVLVSRLDIVRDVRKIMRNAGFEEMKFDESKMLLWVIIKRPSFNQRNELSLEANRLERSIRQSVANVKRDTLERLRAAVEREYIEEVDVKPTIETIETIYTKTMEHVKLISIRRQKQIMDNYFVFDGKEEEQLWEESDNSIYDRMFVKHDIDYSVKPVLPLSEEPKKKTKKSGNIKQIIFASKPTDFDDEILKSILRSSKANNTLLKVTGSLICRSDFYFQFLEGPHEAIDTLYKKIMADKRHANIKKLREDFADSRIFSSWSMKYDFNKSWMWSAAEVKKGVLRKLKSDEAFSIFEKLASQTKDQKKNSQKTAKA
ncbi:BLUF domain-containing protein [Alphaproteobacteria bacterium]|nr:BLUF domain-containing protein [Alphaproteobacteria bacterium]